MKSNLKEDFPIDFSSFISHLPIAAFVADDQGRIVFSNPLWLDATGFLEGEIQSVEQMDTLESHFSHKLSPLLHELFSFKHPENITFSVVHKTNQKTAYFKLTASLFQKQYVLFSAVDITGQVRLQDLLHNKKNQFFSIINSLGDVVFKVNKKGDILSIWTNNFSDYFPGVSSNQKTNLYDCFPEGIANSFSTAIRDSILNLKGQSKEVEFSYTCEGKDRYYLAKIAPIQTQALSEIDEFIFILRDVTEEKKIKRQVKYKNRLIKQLTSISNGPLLHVIEGNPIRFKFISGNLTSLTGNLDKETSEMNWLDMIHENDRESVLVNLQELKSNPKVLYKDLVYRIITLEGNINWVNNHISKADDGGQDVLIGVILNVTEIQLLNDKLRQRERIVTNTSKVAMIGGWEFDFKKNQFNLTDEIYQIHEKEQWEFDVPGSLDYYAEEHQPLIRQHFKDLIEKGKNFNDELQIVTRRGIKKWVKAVGCAEWNNGQITHIYGILQDIDEKKKQDLTLQENEKRFNAAFELAPLGIGLLSIEGQWLRVNSSLCRFFEFSAKELIKIPINELKLTNVFNNSFDWEWISLNNRNAFQLEEKYHTVNGNIKWGRISISSVKNQDGTPAYFILQVVDITENKQYEENLILAKKEAETANTIKSDFLSTMTHEIRTPLYGVIGLTNLLLEEIHDPQHREHLKALKFSSDSLLLLVNDILDFSKIKSGILSLEMRPFDLRRLVEAIEELNFLKSKEGGNKISLHYDENLSNQYIGDELRIGQIINNLVNNAVKFTSNGLIGISIKKSGESENKHHILFSIKDNGIGIAEDVQPFIFDQFIQAEAGTSRKYGGTGLGLPIVKGLLEAMDSHVKLKSGLGKGTDISFELSLEKPKPGLLPSIPKNSDQKKDLHKKTILLVEDNPVSMMVANDYIKRWNGNVIKAVDGEEAVKKFIENINKIDLVLMDIQIPLLNGFEAAKQIKKAKPDVPIIALTASIENKDQFNSNISYIIAYQIKPFIPEDFYHTLQIYLE